MEFQTRKNLISQYPNQIFVHRNTCYLAAGQAVLAKKDVDLKVKSVYTNVDGSYFPAMIIQAK